MKKVLKFNIFIFMFSIISLLFVNTNVFASEDQDIPVNDYLDRRSEQIVYGNGHYSAQCTYGNGYQINVGTDYYEEFYLESTDYYEFMEYFEDSGYQSITFHIIFKIYSENANSNSSMDLYLKHWHTSPNYYLYFPYYIMNGTHYYHIIFNMGEDDLGHSTINNSLCLFYTALNNSFYLQSTTVHVTYNTYNVTPGFASYYYQ